MDKLSGHRPDPANKIYKPFERTMFNGYQPGEADLRQHSSPRHNQRLTNSCVAQSVIKALEIKRIQKYGHTAHVDLSVMDLYYGCRDLMDPKETHIDEGTHISLACDVLRRYGVCREVLHKFGSDNLYTPPPVLATREAYMNKIKANFRITSVGWDRVDDVVANLQMGNPVVFGTTVGDNWKKYDSYSQPLAPLKWEDVKGRHATCLVGYVNGLFITENSWGCYDKETEILTERGWKSISEVLIGESVATLNPNTNELEYQNTTDVQNFPFIGDLISFQSQGVDLKVTPNHNMYIGYESTKNYRHHIDWKLTPADEIDSNMFKIKKNANWQGEEAENFQYKDLNIKMDIWLEFLGYFISEGHTSGNTRNRPARQAVSKNGNIKYYKKSIERYNVVGISQVKENNLSKIDFCLQQMPQTFKRHGVAWTSNSKILYEYLKPLGKSYEKYIPQEYKKLSKRQLIILLNALILGDGTPSGKNGYIYYTSSKKLADDVQEIALKCGYAADIAMDNRIGRIASNGVTRHINYIVSIKPVRGITCPRYGFKSKLEYYCGMVHCVTVPNHIIYVRRNGKAVWCGNSDWGDNGYGWLQPEVIAHADSKDFWVIALGSEVWMEGVK